MIITFLNVNELISFYATDYNNMSKLLNRILKVEVELQNLLFKYRQTSNIRRTLVDNKKIVDHPDVVGVSQIACRCCSNYIFKLDLTPGFNGPGKSNSKMRWQWFKFCALVWLTLEILRYFTETLTAIILRAKRWDMGILGK